METGIKVSEDISDEYNKGQGAGLNLFFGYGVFNFKICKVSTKKPLIFQKLGRKLFRKFQRKLQTL